MATPSDILYPPTWSHVINLQFQLPFHHLVNTCRLIFKLGVKVLRSIGLTLIDISSKDFRESVIYIYILYYTQSIHNMA